MIIRWDTYLVITDVVVAFVDTFAVRAVAQCLCYVLDVGRAVYEGAYRPTGISLGHAIQVYCG